MYLMWGKGILGFVLALWPLIDRILLKVYHIMPLRTDNSGLISVELRSYKGPSFKLGDGSEIKTGDSICRAVKFGMPCFLSPQLFLAY